MKTLFDTRHAIRKIGKAFNLLRREGVSAHLRYVCCGQCGASDAPLFGSYVFYRREHELDFKTIGVMPIYFRSPDSNDYNAAHALGDMVRIALELSGLTVEWSGDPDHPVVVMA